MQVTERTPWLPEEIGSHPLLSPRHKALLSEIERLGGNDLGCWAGDVYLAVRIDATPGRVRQMIDQLVRHGFLKVERDGWVPGGRHGRILRLLGYPERPEAER